MAERSGRPFAHGGHSGLETVAATALRFEPSEHRLHPGRAGEHDPVKTALGQFLDGSVERPLRSRQQLDGRRDHGTRSSPLQQVDQDCGFSLRSGHQDDPALQRATRPAHHTVSAPLILFEPRAS